MIHTISGEAIVTILLRVYYSPLVENCCTGCSYAVICNVIIPIIKVLGLWCLIRVITKLPNSKQSYKGKVKTRKYINRQISQQPENCENRNDPDLVQAFLKIWWVESNFKAPNLPLSLRLKGSGCHYSSIYNNTGTK
jgi:predicted ferric reductase